MDKDEVHKFIGILADLIDARTGYNQNPSPNTYGLEQRVREKLVAFLCKEVDNN